MAIDVTGYYGDLSALQRQEWAVEGLIQARSKSIFDGLVGSTAGAVIYQKNMNSAKNGQRVTFDYDGNYAAQGFLGKETAYGRAGSKKKFTSGITTDRIRYTVGNGDKWDAQSVGSTQLSEHSHSMTLLSDNFGRSKDQNFINAFQGTLGGVNPSHVFSPSDTNTIAGANLSSATDKWTFAFIQELELKLGEGDGFVIGSKRRPLEAINGMYLVYLDAYAHMQLLQDPSAQTIFANAGVRGDGNVLLKNEIGSFGVLKFMKMPTFFGELKHDRIAGDIVEIAGLKRADANGNWSGTGSFAAAGSGTNVYARSFIVGANALQYGVGYAPEYRVQESNDFGITSESALITYQNVQKTQLLAEDEDYIEAKVGGIDYGCIVIDSYAYTA